MDTGETMRCLPFSAWIALFGDPFRLLKLTASHLKGWMISHCIVRPHCLYLFISTWKPHSIPWLKCYYEWETDTQTHSGTGLLDHLVVLDTGLWEDCIFIFGETPYCFPQGSTFPHPPQQFCLFYSGGWTQALTPARQALSFGATFPEPHLHVYYFLIAVFLGGVNRWLIVILIRVSLVISTVDHFFPPWTCHLYVFFWEMSVQV